MSSGNIFYSDLRFKTTSFQFLYKAQNEYYRKQKGISRLMRKLLIVVISVLVGCTFLTKLAALAPPIGKVDVLSHSSFLDSLGWYHVVGEALNTGHVHLRDVKITATFYDSENREVATKSGYTFINVLLVGRKSPFEVILLSPIQSAEVNHYNLNVTFNSYPSGKPIGLEILSNSSYIDSERMHVVGEVKNTGSTKATYVQVMATFYDAKGKVVDCEWTYSDPDEIDPDQESSFEITLYDVKRVPLVTSYSLTAESIEYAIIPEFSTWIALLCVIAITTVVVIFSAHASTYCKPRRAQK